MLYVLGGLLAGFAAVQNVLRSAILPNLVAPELVNPAIALNFGLTQLTYVVGPGLGGIMIGLAGVGAAYTMQARDVPGDGRGGRGDGAAAAGRPRPGAGSREPVLRSIAEGLRFVRRNNALLGSFAIDLLAMTFGMPRALFAVLAVSVYGAGAEGTGLLYAAVAAGATVAALMTGWLAHARRLGRITIWAVGVWGVAIALAGLAGSLWVAAALLAVGGRGRQRQRRVPLGDQPVRHAGPPARAHVVGVHARRRERAAPGRRRGGHRRRARGRALLDRLGRARVPRGRRARRARVPGAGPLRRARPARSRPRSRSRRRCDPARDG